LAARNGISVNLLTIRAPSQVGISDSCPYGMGGFTWLGRAWRIRIRIPEESPIYGDSTANNVLEFLAMAVTIWIIIRDCDANGQECVMSLGDNTSAIGWMFRSSKLSPDSPYYKPVQFIVRKLAILVTRSGHCLCAQHLKGDRNVVADFLSFDRHQRRSDDLHPLACDEPDDE
jgi:hypothetical protein